MACTRTSPGIARWSRLPGAGSGRRWRRRRASDAELCLTQRSVAEHRHRGLEPGKPLRARRNAAGLDRAGGVREEAIAVCVEHERLRAIRARELERDHHEAAA